jgi:hypothetical protein
VIDFVRAEPLSAKKWDEFETLLAQASYWTLPTRSRGIPGKDGTMWFLEAVVDGRYHNVGRWSPDGGKFKAACSYLLGLAGLSKEPDYN